MAFGSTTRIVPHRKSKLSKRIRKGLAIRLCFVLAAADRLSGRALEIVDDRGRVRASITVFPADPKVKIPDGSTGYPETVLLRLINSKGRPNIKIDASEAGSGAMVGGESDPM